MNKILNASSVFLLRLLMKRALFYLFGAMMFKGLFILLQLLAVWIMITWIGGAVIPVVKGVVQFEDASYVYPAISGVILISASVFSFLARWIALGGIRKVELHIFELTQGEGLIGGDYRNVSKLMLGLIDALVPSTFIAAVLLAWLVVMPSLILPFALLVILVSLVFRKGARFSARTFKSGIARAKPQEYIGSDEHRNFYKVLMVPQYIALGTYTLIAAGMVAAVVLMQYLSESLLSFGLLPVATALALLQFKSFISLLVRMGAYAGNASRVVSLMLKITN